LTGRGELGLGAIAGEVAKLLVGIRARHGDDLVVGGGELDGVEIAAVPRCPDQQGPAVVGDLDGIPERLVIGRCTEAHADHVTAVVGAPRDRLSDIAHVGWAEVGPHLGDVEPDVAHARDAGPVVDGGGGDPGRVRAVAGTVAGVGVVVGEVVALEDAVLADVLVGGFHAGIDEAHAA
jgi:hypothetical protein